MDVIAIRKMQINYVEQFKNNDGDPYLGFFNILDIKMVVLVLIAIFIKVIVCFFINKEKTYKRNIIDI